MEGTMKNQEMDFLAPTVVADGHFSNWFELFEESPEQTTNWFVLSRVKDSLINYQQEKLR